MRLLQGLGIDVRTQARVTEVRQDGVRLADGYFIPSELVVWAAGVKAPDLLKDLDGLEANRSNQLVVTQTLQTTRDTDVFAIGDCACLINPGETRPVPPRAQAASQQSTHLSKQMRRRLDGKPLQVIGKRGVHSDTGCDKPGDLVPRAAGPFNYPTEMVPSPSGDLYISDGYRNARVHRFTRDGQLVKSWGAPGKTEPGHFHLPHSVLVAPDGKVYVCDRTNRRVQIFSADGEFLSMWTGMGGPNDISRDKDGVFYVCEQEADGAPPFVSIRDGDGAVLARWEIRHAHGLWVDSHGDIYLGLTTNHSVDKYVRVE